MCRKTTWIALGLLCQFPLLAQAATQTQIDQAWNKGVAWLMLNQHGDGGWSSTLNDGNVVRQGVGIQATAAAVDTLSALGIKSGYTYLGGTAWLSNAEPASVDALARQVLALKPSGMALTPYGTRLTTWRNNWKTWGAYPEYEHSVIDTALGMRAMLEVNPTEAGWAVCELLAGQHAVAPDYGWSHIKPPSGSPAGQSASAVAPTAQAVTALKRYAGASASLTCAGSTSTTYTMSTVYANAAAWLLTKKNLDNGFGDNGTSGVLESALALRMLKDVAPSNAATQTTIDYLIAQQGVDGSWRSGDALQTAEALSALSSASTVAGQRPSATVATDTDKDGIPNGVETVMGTNPAVADSRFLAGGSGAVVTQPAAMLAAARVTSAPQATSVASVSGVSGVTTSWNKTVDLEVFIAGTSAQMPVLEVALQRLFQAGTMETLLDDGGARGAVSGELYRAYYGRRLADGRSLLVHFSAQGGSEIGAVAVARAQSVSRMVIDKNCIQSGADGRWSCPEQHQVAGIPDAGISEVQPDWYGGENSSGARPLSSTELSSLDAKPINAMAFGVGATNALRGAGLSDLSNDALARLITAKVRGDWHEINPALPAMPIIVCRLGKGAQPAAEALTLGTGCNKEAPSAASAVTSATGQLAAPGYLIVENDSTDGVVSCLDRAQQGGVMRVNGEEISVTPGSFAIGIIGAERVPHNIERWGFIRIDSMEPIRDVLIKGGYSRYAEAWMQWRKSTVNKITPVSGKRLAVLRDLRATLEALTPSTEKATATLSEMSSSRGGNVCNEPQPKN